MCRYIKGEYRCKNHTNFNNLILTQSNLTLIENYPLYIYTKYTLHKKINNYSKITLYYSSD